MMTPEQVTAILTTAGLKFESVHPLTNDNRGTVVGVRVVLDRHGSWAYDALATAAAALGTTNINFEWRSENGDYSEFTPGDPSVHEVEIRW